MSFAFGTYGLVKNLKVILKKTIKPDKFSEPIVENVTCGTLSEDCKYGKPICIDGHSITAEIISMHQNSGYIIITTKQFTTYSLRAVSDDNDKEFKMYSKK